MSALEETTQHFLWWHNKGKTHSLWTEHVPWGFRVTGWVEGGQPDGGHHKRTLSLEDVWELREGSMPKGTLWEG